MIIKTIRINKEKNESKITYIDNIVKTYVSDNVIEYRLKEQKTELNPSIIIEEYDSIFLMNDDGKTVEVIGRK